METFLHLFRDPDVFRDPVWQFVGVVLTLCFGGITVKLALLQRSCKGLSYDVVSQASLQQGDKDLMGLLEISFDHKPVRDVHLITVRIYNSGNVPILSADYEVPITIRFGKQSKILRAKIVNQNPVSLPILMDVASDRGTIHPALLNPGDAFAVEFLVDQPDVQDRPYSYAEKLVDVKVVGRIVGVKEIRNSFYKKSLSFCSLASRRENWWNRLFVSSAPRLPSANAAEESVSVPLVKPSWSPPYAIPSVPEEEWEDEEIAIAAENLVHTENENTKFHEDIGEDAPITQWENLPEKQKMLCLNEAVASLKDKGIPKPSRAVVENVAKGLWQEQNATKLGIYKEYQAAKARSKKAPMEEDVRKASRRFPEADTKD